MVAIGRSVDRASVDSGAGGLGRISCGCSESTVLMPLFVDPPTTLPARRFGEAAEDDPSFSSRGQLLVGDARFFQRRGAGGRSCGRDGHQDRRCGVNRHSVQWIAVSWEFRAGMSGCAVDGDCGAAPRTQAFLYERHTRAESYDESARLVILGRLGKSGGSNFGQPPGLGF